MRSAL